jgi:ribosomal protein L37E
MLAVRIQKGMKITGALEFPGKSKTETKLPEVSCGSKSFDDGFQQGLCDRTGFQNVNRLRSRSSE